MMNYDADTRKHEAMFRVTGPAAIDRIMPLLPAVCPNVSWINVINSKETSKKSMKAENLLDNDKYVSRNKGKLSCDDPQINHTVTLDNLSNKMSTHCTSAILASKSSTIDIHEPNQNWFFVWETTCEKHLKAQHDDSIVLNRLHNTQVLENKAHLAIIQFSIKRNVIQTYIAKNYKDVKLFCEYKWASSKTTYSTEWWVVKSSQGNGGKDIWVMNADNYSNVLENIPKQDQFVIQKYIENPLLWNHKKFHFRCYTMIKGDMSSYFYTHAFILTASHNYSKDDANEMLTHLTNLSVNKKSHQHPGQVPVSLEDSFPDIMQNMIQLWSDLVGAAIRFICRQTSIHHFDFYGIDIIADTSNNCWLLECNRLPGLESSKNNIIAEDALYNSMMTSLLKIVTREPLRRIYGIESSEEAPEALYKGRGIWRQVCDPQPIPVDPSADGGKHLNLLNWLAYHRKNIKNLSVDTLLGY